MIKTDGRTAHHFAAADAVDSRIAIAVSDANSTDQLMIIRLLISSWLQLAQRSAFRKPICSSREQAPRCPAIPAFRCEGVRVFHSLGFVVRHHSVRRLVLQAVRGWNAEPRPVRF